MSVQVDPIPPVPEHTPPLKEDEVSRGAFKFFNQTWTRWFVSLRDKVNVINESLVNLGVLAGSGLVTKSGDAWGTVGTGSLIQGSNVILTGALTDRLVGAGDITIESTGGVASVDYTRITAVGDIRITADSNLRITD